jgi:putative acetyltransferase
MIKIVPIEAHQVEDAKHVISAVAQRIFEPDMTVQEFYDVLADEGELHDVDEFQASYTDDRGLFLVVMDNDQLVGTGALKKLDGEIAELKRLWLLEEYHGQKIGYQVTQKLLEFGRQKGYRRVRLQTSERQKRAVEFYKQLGFYEIASYRDSLDNISMEKEI